MVKVIARDFLLPNPIWRRLGFALWYAARFLVIGYEQKLFWDSTAERLM
jgi:hypothetical protein